MQKMAKCFSMVLLILCGVVSLTCTKKQEDSPVLAPDPAALAALEFFYVGTSSGLFVSYDGGASFQQKSTTSVHALAVEAGIIALLDETSVLFSNFGTNGWDYPRNAIASGVPLAAALTDGKLFVGTSYGFNSDTNFEYFQRPQILPASLVSPFGSNYIRSISGFGGNVFAGSPDKGLFYTVEGDSYNPLWFEIYNPAVANYLPSNNILSLEVDPPRKKVYVGTDQGLVVGTLSDSTGLRGSWVTLSGNPGFASSAEISDIDFFADRICVATTGGISISTDLGDTWTTTIAGQNGFAPSSQVYGCSIKGNVVLAGTADGLAISNDGGATWTAVRSGERGLTTNTITQVAIDRAKKTP